MNKQLHERFTKEIGNILKLIDEEKYNSAFKKINMFLKRTSFEKNYLTFLKGLVLGRLGKVKPSLSLMNNLLKKDLKNDIREMILISKGESLLQSNKYKEALSVLNKSLLLPTTDKHTALEYKAKALMGLKKYDEALITLKKANLMDTTCTSTIANTGICYLYKNNFSKALQFFKKVYKTDQKDLKILKLIFMTYYRLKNFSQAKYYVDKILELEKNFASYAYKADISAFLKDYNSALSYYEKALIEFKSYPKICEKCGKPITNYYDIMTKLIKNYTGSLLKVNKLNKALDIIKWGLKMDKNNKQLHELKNKVVSIMK